MATKEQDDARDEVENPRSARPSGPRKVTMAAGDPAPVKLPLACWAHP